MWCPMLAAAAARRARVDMDGADVRTIPIREETLTGKLQWVLKRSFLKRNGPDIRPSYCPDRPRPSFRR